MKYFKKDNSNNEKDSGLNEENSDKTKNRKIENLIVFIIICVFTIMMVNFIFSKNSKKDNKIKTENFNNIELVQVENNQKSDFQNGSSDTNIEENLKKILGKIDGVGDVDVLITYSETKKTVPIYNENSEKSKTEETDNEGGTRKIESYSQNKEVVQNNSEILTEKIVMPKMEGAIIIARGANNINIKNNIILAVEAATGLAVHKIQVFEMKD